MKVIKSLRAIQQQMGITKPELVELQEVTEQFQFQVTPAILDMIDQATEKEVITKQFLPSLAELTLAPGELSDPIGDEPYEVVKGVVHRYPDRCLLKIVNICPVYCRFCFRKEMIGPRKKSLSVHEITTAINYIKDNSSIWEVILTGGDPLILKPDRLKRILHALDTIDHVAVIRIHTRIPVIDPDRISEELVASLKLSKAIYIVIHANHAEEFTPASISACAKLVDAGIPLLSQTVLLQGVNDSELALSTLMKTFVKNRIKPYYLHHPDMAKGTSHFRVSITRGQELMKYLQGRFSGLCQPTYVLEVPGGYGKMPIGPCYLAKEKNSWLVEDYLGRLHEYEEI